MSGWRVGDLEPGMAGTFTSEGIPTSLEVALGAALHIKRPDGTVLNRPVTRLNQTTDPGEWTLALVLNDFNTAGIYRAELEIEWTSGRKQTTPTVAFAVGEQIA